MTSSRRIPSGTLHRSAGGAAILVISPALLWTRVAGDVLDVALLVTGLAPPHGRRGRGIAAAAALTVIGAADVVAAAKQNRGGAP